MRSNLILRFLEGNDSVDVHIAQGLLDPARPLNFQLLYLLIGSQAKMHSAVAGRCITDGRRNLIPLGTAIGGDQVNLRSDRHAIALRPNQVEQNPMLPADGDIVKKLHRPAQHGNYGVDPAIIVQIAKCNAAMRRFFLEIRPSHGADIDELSRSQISKDASWAPDTVVPATNAEMLSSTFDRATNRSFQPSLSKSNTPFPQPDICDVDLPNPATHRQVCESPCP